MGFVTTRAYDEWKPILPDELMSIPTQPGPYRHASAIFVGTGGHLSLTGTDGKVALFKNVPSGIILQVRATYVNSAGTTASDLVALYRSYP